MSDADAEHLVHCQIGPGHGCSCGVNPDEPAWPDIPPAAGCRTCDQAAPDCLTWAEYDTPVGVARVIQCQDCLDEEVAPRFSWVEAVRLVNERNALLGIEPTP